MFKLADIWKLFLCSIIINSNILQYVLGPSPNNALLFCFQFTQPLNLCLPAFNQQFPVGGIPGGKIALGS